MKTRSLLRTLALLTVLSVVMQPFTASAQAMGDSSKMKGDAMKKDAMKGDAMKGDAMKGDAMKQTSRYRAGESGLEERAAIIAALAETNGTLSKTAALLGMGRTALWRKLRGYGLESRTESTHHHAEIA